MTAIRTVDLRMDSISVPARIRKDNGDIGALAQSIHERGLINPITVMETTEGGYLLIAGLRRLEACRSLGIETIRASVLSPRDADEQLMLEIAENEQRKEFTISERLEYAAKLKAVESAKAKQRQTEKLRRGTNSSVVGKCPQRGENAEDQLQGRTRDIVADKAGFTSSRQLARAERIAAERPDLLEKIDAGEETISGAFKKAVKSTPDFVPDAAIANAPVVPETTLRKRLSREDREALRHIEEQVVVARPVAIEALALFDPATVAVTGEPDSIPGASHRALTANPVYSALYEKYKEAVYEANIARGALRTERENYEKRIRAYEERQRAMTLQIERLNAQIEEAQHAGA